MIALKDSLGTEFVERIRTIFSENGLLSKAANFEFRPQQQAMAVAVARALEEDRHLVVEAGTGVGKSLAYLVPAILFALEHHKKAIVSTPSPGDIRMSQMTTSTARGFCTSCANLIACSPLSASITS